MEDRRWGRPRGPWCVRTEKLDEDEGKVEMNPFGRGGQLVGSPDWGSKAFNSPSDEQASCSSLLGKKRSGFAEAAENREAGQAQAHQQGAGGFGNNLEIIGVEVSLVLATPKIPCVKFKAI